MMKVNKSKSSKLINIEVQKKILARKNVVNVWLGTSKEKHI